jgi:4-amino-4-deoxy-L-arabinose transferase-like glycosyltransferase
MEKEGLKKKEYIFLIILILLLFILQLSIADRTIFGDDHIFATFAEENTFFYTENAHPPLPVWSDIAITEILPLTNRTIRLTSIIFTLATIALVYIIGRRESKAIAIIAALITGLSAWHIRASQMNSGSDGGMFTFFFLLAMYFFMEYTERKQIRNLVFAGIALGFTMLSKESGILFLPIAALYYITNIKKTQKSTILNKVKNIFKTGLLLSIIALTVFSIFPVADTLFNNGQNLDAIMNRIDTVAEERPQNLFLWVFSLFKVFIWAGPLLIFIPLLAFLNTIRGRERKKLWKDIFWIQILFIGAFYILFVPANLDKTRYLMLLIPALAIVSARYLTSIKTINWNKKTIATITIATILLFAIFLAINTSFKPASYESTTNPMTQIKSGQFDFTIPLFTETDNSGFGMNFRILFMTILVSGFALTTMLYKKWQPLALILLIILSLSYNGFIIAEYGFHATSPNYSDAIKDITAYAQENQLEEPLFLLKNYELQFYLRNNYNNDAFVTRYGLSETNTETINAFRTELQNDATVIFTDMPFIDKEGILWKTINQECTKVFTTEDKAHETGYIFSCN